MKRHEDRGTQEASGFLLLEVIVALTVFSLVAVGLAVALQSSIDASNRLARDLAVREGLEGMLVEARTKHCSASSARPSCRIAIPFSRSTRAGAWSIPVPSCSRSKVANNRSYRC